MQEIQDCTALLDENFNNNTSSDTGENRYVVVMSCECNMMGRHIFSIRLFLVRNLLERKQNGNNGSGVVAGKHIHYSKDKLASQRWLHMSQKEVSERTPAYAFPILFCIQNNMETNCDDNYDRGESCDGIDTEFPVKVEFRDPEVSESTPICFPISLLHSDHSEVAFARPKCIGLRTTAKDTVIWPPSIQISFYLCLIADTTLRKNRCEERPEVSGRSLVQNQRLFAFQATWNCWSIPKPILPSRHTNRDHQPQEWCLPQCDVRQFSLFCISPLAFFDHLRQWHDQFHLHLSMLYLPAYSSEQVHPEHWHG